MNILVVRNDKLGDFMLAWPAFALLKHYLPHSHVTALVPAYTAPMARLCPWLDAVLLDDPAAGGLALARQLRAGRFDALLTLFSTGRVGLAGCLAHIPYRLAPATKLAQLCYNHRLVQRRSRSEKPEYAYNTDLVRRLLQDHGRAAVVPEANADPLAAELTRPLLRFPDTAAAGAEFRRRHGFAPDARLVFIHPGSGGSARNLTVEQYAHLARALRGPLACVVGCGPGEEWLAERLAALLGEMPHTILRSPDLAAYARHIALADLFLSGSTGPLHIAGALDVPTAAFYPRRRSATPLRWQTLNAPARRLAFTPPEEAGEAEMAAIDLMAAAAAIQQHLLT